MKPHIEVELRSIFDKKRHEKLKSFFQKHATDLGEDDKDVYFFILPDKLFKVVNNISKKTAKLVLKLNKIGKGHDFEEIEISINPKEIDKAVKLFSGLGYTEIQHSFQKRHNYIYKDVELALKYSKVWGYHLELELLVDSKDKIRNAESKLRTIALELGVDVMTNEELAIFTKRKDEELRKKLRKEKI